MPRLPQRKIIRLLGVGFDTEDDHVRITKGERFDVYMGSEASHEFISELIRKIEFELQARNMELDDLTPEEFQEFVRMIQSS